MNRAPRLPLPPWVLCCVSASLHETCNCKPSMRVRIKKVFTGTGLSVHVEPVAQVAFAVEGAGGADAAVLAAMLLLHTHVHPCKTERASEQPTGTLDAWGPWLWPVPCPQGRSHHDNPHSPSPSSPSTHPLISSARTQTLHGVGF